MFEGSLVESRGLVTSGARRWTALGSLTVQCGVVALLLTIPVVRPDSLPLMSVVPRLSVPAPVRPPAPLVHVHTTATAANAVSVPASAPAATATRRFTFPRPGAVPEGPAPAVETSGLGWGSGSSTVLSAVSDAGPVAVMRARDIGPVRVSKGVSEGMLLAPIRPVYPPIARAAKIEGTVVLEAVISKAGRIESLRAVSGPDMLRRAALDAVQAARYAPYKLSGEAVEVETTITVVFRLGS